MKRETIPFTTEAAWLDLRLDDITSTMMPALFGMSPYATKFELYHAKASDLHLEFKSNERVDTGKWAEEYLARAYREKTGIPIEPFKDYIRLTEHKIGSSFDYIATHERKLVEIKLVDQWIHKGWEDGELPAHIEIQAQHEMLVAGIDEIDVFVVTGLYPDAWHIYPRKADKEVQAAMLKACAAFWADVEAKNEPEPDFNRDGEVIAALYKPEGELLDYTNKAAEFDRLSREIKDATELEKNYKDAKTAAKNELFHLLGDSMGGFTDKYRIKAGRTKDTVGKEITAEMVGTVTGARKGYRRCDITELKG